MKVELEPAGERVIEDAYHRSLGGYVIFMMHAASYGFAETFCRSKQVLDLGCGSGYGCFRLASIARSVHGVDVSAEAIEFAARRYEAANLQFSHISAGDRLPFPDESFDTVLSFQVIEHVEGEADYLEEARRVLRPGGVMIIITPDRQHRLLPGQKPWNRWHLREYSAASLSRLVEPVLRVKRVLRMGAPWDVAKVEYVRYRWTKWLTLPLTLPLVPDRIRRWGLDLIHAVKGRGAAVDAGAPEKLKDFGFGEEVMIFDENPPNPLNLVVVAERPAVVSR